MTVTPDPAREAREAKWAEHLDLDLRRAHDRMVVDATMALADAEQAALVADEQAWRDAYQERWEQAVARAEAAEAKLAEARAENDRIWAEVEKHLATIEQLRAEGRELRATVKRVEALADVWYAAGDATAHVLVCKKFSCPDCSVIACATDLRAAALAVPAPPVTQTSENDECSGGGMTCDTHGGHWITGDGPYPAECSATKAQAAGEDE